MGGRGKLWAFVPVALLVATVTGWGLMISLALDDPGFGVEPDYYDKAVNFDAGRALEQESRRLGWSLSLELGSPRQGKTDVAIRLADRTGAPLRGATVTAIAFANARSSQIHELVLSPRGQGRYTASLPSSRTGLWEFRFRVDRGSNRYLEVVRADVGKGDT